MSVVDDEIAELTAQIAASTTLEAEIQAAIDELTVSLNIAAAERAGMEARLASLV